MEILRLIRDAGPEGILAQDIRKAVNTPCLGSYLDCDDMIYEETTGDGIRYFWCGK